jgi:hypothetical protein
MVTTTMTMATTTTTEERKESESEEKRKSEGPLRWSQVLEHPRFAHLEPNYDQMAGRFHN